MKPFDITKAKQGHPIQTRLGIPAEIIYWNAKGNFPIVAIIHGNDDDLIESYTTEGHWSEEIESNLDLLLAPTKHTGYINLYREPTGYKTNDFVFYSEEKAKEHKHDIQGDYIQTIQIEWEK